MSASRTKVRFSLRESVTRGTDERLRYLVVTRSCLLETTSDLPILTMSDATDFAEGGGRRQLLHWRRPLAIQRQPRSGHPGASQVSSRLLSLARIVGS